MEVYRQFRRCHIILQKCQIFNGGTHLESAVCNCAWVNGCQQLLRVNRHLLRGAIEYGRGGTSQFGLFFLQDVGCDILEIGYSPQAIS